MQSFSFTLRLSLDSPNQSVAFLCFWSVVEWWTVWMFYRRVVQFSDSLEWRGNNLSRGWKMEDNTDQRSNYWSIVFRHRSSRVNRYCLLPVWYWRGEEQARLEYIVKCQVYVKSVLSSDKWQQVQIVTMQGELAEGRDGQMDSWWYMKVG